MQGQAAFQQVHTHLSQDRHLTMLSGKDTTTTGRSISQDYRAPLSPVIGTRYSLRLFSANSIECRARDQPKLDSGCSVLGLRV